MQKKKTTASPTAVSADETRLEEPPQHAAESLRRPSRANPVVGDNTGLESPTISAGMLTSLFMHLPGGVILLDDTGCEVFANESGSRLSRAIALGANSIAANAAPDQTGSPLALTHGTRITASLAGRDVPDGDYVLGTPGERRHRVVQVGYTPQRDVRGRITGLVLTLTDLTDRVDGQAKLARAADALAEVTRETLARIAVTQAQDNRDLTQSNNDLEQQAALGRAADAMAEVTRKTLERMAEIQAQDNRDLTRSNSELEQQASMARAADTLAEATRESLARIAVTQARDNRDLTRSNTQLERQATVSRAADAEAEATRESLARIAVTQAQDNRDLTRSNTQLERQATVSRAADALAEATRESLARIAVTQAQDNRDLTRSNSQLEQQATVSRAADALAVFTREALARIAVTQAESNQTLTRSNTELEQQAAITRAADAVAEITRETLARIAVAQARDNRDLALSNTELEHQASLARAADALAEVTRGALAREADLLALKAVSQAQDNRDLVRSNTDLERQATLARVADALAEVTRETLARKAGVLARKAVTQARDNRDLTRSNAGLEQFASVASHDLQEPLRKIQAFGDRLKSVDGAALSPAGADYLDRMQHAAARMQVLINDLLAYARVSAEPPSVESVDLAAVTRAVLTDLESQVAESGGNVEVGPLPMIEGDPLRLRQLLQNLISNALKFRRPTTPPHVTISARLAPAGFADIGEPAWVDLTVQDDGIGFEAKHAERIFEVFKRLHGRSAYEGTGIGLALCRQIAEQHGGHISATSTPGQGTMLRVVLPLRQTQEVGTA